jgi:hypothetical protein
VCLSAGFIIEIKLIIKNKLIYLKAAIRLTKKNDEKRMCDKNRESQKLAYISHNGNKVGKNE